ncbi:Calx-beta domain-containing protein [Synechococcus elongatus PCC 11802]|uniref:Calx-beta domain-containing protein n=1 Tax=Synechococcus elongatus PCC 11802 TaxID=2283154 RepID=A0AAT9JZK7_SYNEL
MSLLHIISGGGSGGTGLLPGLGNLLNGALRGVNDLLDISNSLNLPSLSSALNTNSLLSNSLLNTVNRLLDADADTTVIEDLFGTLNGLLSRGQPSFAQGLIDTVNRLLDGNVSTTVIDDLVNTVNRLLSNGQTGLVDDLTNTVNALLGAGQGNLVDDLIATVNGLLGGGQTTLIDDLTNTVNRLLTSGQTGLIDDLTNTVNSLLGAGQGNLVDDLIATVNNLIDGQAATTVINDLLVAVNQLLGSTNLNLIDDLLNNVNNILIGGGVVTNVISIVDDLLGGTTLPVISVIASDAIAAEGGSNTGTFTLSRTGSTTQALTVAYTLAGTATNGSDFSQLSGSVTFAAGSSTATVTVNPLDDAVVEGDETVVLAVANNPSYTIAPGQGSATVTIQDNDTPPVALPVISVIASDAIAAEGGSNTSTFTLSRTGSTTQALTVAYTLAGTATNGSDFSQLSGSVTFAAGSNTATVTLSPINDSLVEGDETVVLAIANNASYTIAPGQGSATVTIQDNDTPPVALPVISVIASDAIAAEGGSNTGTFTLSRTGSTTQALTVAYTLAGTATNGSDFSQLSGSVTFAAGSNTATVTLSPINDSLVEGDETVVLAIANNASYTIAPGQGSATVTIQDNDTPPVALPVISVIASDAIAAEGGSNTSTFTLSRTGSTTQALTVAYTLAGTATNGSDFSQLSGSVTFAAGSSTATVTVNPLDDAVVEGDETVVLAVANNPSYTIAPGQGSATVTIQDNDTPPVALPVISVIASDAIAAEGGSNTGTFTLSRTGSTTQALTVAYTLAGTATNGSDFSQLSGSVTFAAGSSTATVTVNPLDDAVVEGDETVVLAVANNPSYTIAPGQGSATVTIQDNDTPPVALPVISVIASDAIAAEGGSNTGTFTLSRTGSTTQALTVAYTLAGTATNGSDFSQLSGSVTFAAGSNTATVTLSPINDSLVEGDETVVLAIANNASYTIAPGQGSATVTIQDNDTPPVALPVISVIASDAIAAEGGSNTGTFTLSRTGSTAQALTVAYTLAGTATNGSDFNQLSGSVTFAAGSNTATVTLSPINDSLVEGDETVILSIANNPSYSIAPGQGSATVTIQDNDTPPVALPVISVIASDAIAAEGGSNTSTFTLSRTGSTTQALTVAYTLAGTATNGSDFSQLSGSVTFAAGSSTATVTVNPLDDAVVEGDETVVLAVANNPSYTISPGQGSAIVTIQDNDQGSGPIGSNFRDYQDLVVELAETNGNLGSWRDNLIPQPGRPGPDQAAIQAQRLYIGYFNRAADAGGQQFWVSRLITSSDIGRASRDFANLPEAQALYPILANPNAASDEAITSFINSVFRNVFNRDVDPVGASFFLQRFKELRNSPIQGRVGEIVTQILDGAIGSDATILTQKVALANAYTDSLILSNTPYNPEFGQNGIFSTLEAGASTTEALNVAKIVGQGKAPFLDGTTGSDTLTSFGGSTIVNLGNDTVTDQLIFTSPARGGDLVQLFRSQDVLAIQSSGFAGAPLPTADPITNSVTAATNTANTILVDLRSNLDNANFSNVRFAFDLSSGSLLYDADGNFGGTADQTVLAQLDGFVTSGLILKSTNFDFIS